MAGPVNLIFSRPLVGNSPVNLVFGQADEVPADVYVTLSGTLPALTGSLLVGSPISITLAGTLPDLTGDIRVAKVEMVTLAGTLPGLTGSISALYISGAERPTVAGLSGAWQVADKTETGANGRMQKASPVPTGWDNAWQETNRLLTSAASRHQYSDPHIRPQATSGFQQAIQVPNPALRARQQDGISTIRPMRTNRYQDAISLSLRGASARHQDGIRDRRNWAAGRWQDAIAHYLLHRDRSGVGAHLNRGWESEYQEAMRPLPGMSTVPPFPEPERCYTPPEGDEVHLVFKTPWSDDTNLIFVCERHGPGPDPGETVVVPIKRVYVVLNQSSLRRVDGNIPIPTFAMSLSLDCDSWTWSFSASLPSQAMADLQPSSPGEPILVEAMINGVPYRMQCEKRSRDRSFAQDGFKISGRGLSAILDTPHAPVMSFSNPFARTAQQLMNDVLTDNGVSIGWDIDWQAVDWSVPAGVFVHQGSYISALNAIAGAAGSYLQPDRVAQILRVLPKYPTAPWDWGDVTPDFEIPSAVATVENIEWIDKARYNRVFVSGVQGGVLGRVTRAGTDGGRVGPMVTDPLITTAAAARQRGIPVLADTGSQAAVTLRLPVLPETGIIPPGKFIRYVDGATTRIGLTRSVNVSVDSPETWQTIGLETHV